VQKPLSGRQRSFLRSRAHHLNAVVQIGKQGLSEGIVRQLAEQLRAHELIKVRFAKEAPVDARDAADEIAAQADCHVVQAAGRVLTLYRRHDTKPKLELPGMRIDAKRKRDPRLSLRRAHARGRSRRGSGDSERDAGRASSPRSRGRN
jgi:RNA-binding protein